MAAIPGPLDAMNVEASTTAAADGASVVFDPGEIAEWSVDAGAGGSFKLRTTLAGTPGTQAAVLVDGVQVGTITIGS